MAGLANFWDNRRNDDYAYIDSTVEEYFNLGGVGVNYYKYTGIHDQGEQDDYSQPSKAKSKKTGVKEIQDLFFQENRDRHYDTNPYEVKMIYNMADVDFDVRQFGLFIQADTIYIYVHMRDVVKKLGRKPMNGDVLEMVHMREDTYLDENEDYAINKYYVIQDVARASSGWSPTWRAHIFRLKLTPMTDSQEFDDIMKIEDENSGLDLKSIVSDFGNRMEATEENLKEARHQVPYRNFENYHIYILESKDTGLDYPYVWCGDGIPPNGAKLSYKGKEFPTNAKKGDYFLHLGLEPNILFQYDGGRWIEKETNFRLKWQAATRLLHTFLNNDNITHLDDGCIPEKQPINRVIRPRGGN